MNVANVKTAAEVASATLRALFPRAQSVRLEEVELTDDDRFWRITLSYLEADEKTGLFYGREYKEFRVEAASGTVASMKIRSLNA